MTKPDIKPTVVLFTWHSTKNVALITPFIKHLVDTCGFQCHVVTSDATGKLALLNSCDSSFSVNELLLAYANPTHQPSSGKATTTDHLLDLHLDWLYTPKDPVLLDHPDRKATVDYYSWKQQQLISAYSLFLADVGANTVITWNGSLLVTGALAESADLLGIPSFYMERGLLPGSLVIDPNGVNSDSSIAGNGWQINGSIEPTEDDVLALKAYCQKLGSSNASIVNTGQKKESEAVLAQLRLSPEKPVILLPLQIESDSNIQNNSPYFKSMEVLIGSVTSVLGGTEAQLIVKPHPEDQSRRERIEELCSASDVRCCWELSLQSLLPVTDLVVVINSTVGLEALLQNKPVVTLGRSIYDRKGFTLDLDDTNNLDELVHRALNNLWKPHQDPNFWWFLKTLINHHTFFYDEQPGILDIKPLLSDTLLSSEVKITAPKTRRISELIPTNETLSQLMRGEYTGNVLVIGPLETVMQEIPDQITVLNRSTRPITFLSALTQRYDLMIFMEWPSNPVLRICFSLLRAKKKVILG
ncbi:hypothetical protein [Marinobacter sp. S6332]|uniref:capsular polysaccharide export protein, LipB/KpsS family n=1 Tax=Marinobacter sp. S6332 TaxID=2926403 RepID=UPI001FF60D46|nr:hypothetical protein [Marinobacter sp. S6332]MCK0163987.1 hypothetical protein [Marinobacter sp. S6332]